MILFINNNLSEPYIRFKEEYKKAKNANQIAIEAISISSYNNITNEVSQRYVNLKIIDNDNFIFFTNYKSPKSADFKCHNQISACLYWPSVNVQIRIKAKIKKTSKEYNQNYFSKRSPEKNALAISSKQSKKIDTYDDVLKNYHKSFYQDNLAECPTYWGGYSFTPYYFEFWEGHKSRLNKREVYELKNNDWVHSYIQP